MRPTVGSVVPAPPGAVRPARSRHANDSWGWKAAISRGLEIKIFAQHVVFSRFPLYLSWVLAAISGIGVVVSFVALFLDLGDLYEAMQDILLLLLPVTGYQLGKVNGAFLPPPR